MRHSSSGDRHLLCFASPATAFAPHQLFVITLAIPAVAGPTAAPTAAPTVRPTVELTRYPTPTAVTTSTTTTSSATPNGITCAGLERCTAHRGCRTCLDSVQHVAGHVASTAENGEIQRQFFNALLQTPECSPNMTPAPYMMAAMQDLRFTVTTNPCRTHAGFGVFWCQVQEYLCFLDANCSTCFHALNRRADSSFDILRSPPCVGTSSLRLTNLVDAQCFIFPACSFSKFRCSQLASCSASLELLAGGDGARAARRCTAAGCARLLDAVVDTCTGADAIGCSYWQERCRSDPSCINCVNAMGSRKTLSEIVEGSRSNECAAVRSSDTARHPLLVVFQICPATYISPCVTNAVFCVLDHPLCGRCLDGTAPIESPTCQALLNDSGFGVTSLCAPCPDTIHKINTIVLATAVVGGLSVSGCVAVIFVILAYSRDRHSTRDRIILGLMCANLVYSCCNAVPMNQLHTGDADCGQLVMSFDEIRLARAWWFAGKYALIGFEMMILGTSIWALTRAARGLHKWSETALHGACVTAGVAAFVGFYVRCAQINADGYNSATQSEAVSDQYNHLNPDDDLDDDNPRLDAATHFVAARDKYDGLVQMLLQVWIGLLMIAVFMWVYLRWLYKHYIAAWHDRSFAITKEEIADEWAETRRSLWRARRRLLEMQLEAYSDVAKPMELYVVVFIVFGIPAIVMSTAYCRDNSGADSDNTSVESAGFSNISYRTCDVWCEFVLAFRSFATVVVYFWPRQRRAELFQFHTMARLLLARCATCLAFCLPRQSQRNQSIVSYAFASAGSPLSRSGDDRGVISEDEVELDHQLAKGAFGAVWAGHWRHDSRHVAVKVLMRGIVDEEGDPIDLMAEKDFQHECQMLKIVNHPNLLKFHGYGVRHDGCGFIVTELMDLGSLRDVLGDKGRELPWTTRVSIALHIALGMEHLHALPIVHRDLKSANVLLNRRMEAKVADFGASKPLRPRPAQIVYASFTGARKSVPVTPGIGHLQSDKNAGVSAMKLDAMMPTLTVDVVSDTMTKAVGTLLWMAPEMYRGDMDYAWEVDVYSYGVILWEIALRKTPWREELVYDNFLELVNGLENALQTGRRPSVPDHIFVDRPHFVGLMQRCWAGDPGDRPPFTEIVETLHGFTRQLVPSIYASSTTDDNPATALTEPLLRNQ